MEETINTPTKEILVNKLYTKKNGEQTTRTYNQKKYNETFYNKHKETINQKHLCECSNHYTTNNKSKHEKSKYHQLFVKLSNIPIVL